jgi:hypothetical protein
MNILATLVSEDWHAIREVADPFGLNLGTMGAAAAEEWFTVYFKSGRDNTVEDQGADVVLLETSISGVQHNLILELTKREAQELRAKCDRINRLRDQLDEEQNLADFAADGVADYIHRNG